VKHLKLFEDFLNEAKAKTITVTVHGGKELTYSDSDIQDLIDNMDLGADNLPKWIYVASLNNKQFPKKKEAILNLLKKIKDSKNSVSINVDSEQPSYRHKIEFLNEEFLNESYSGPESVTFDKYTFESIMEKSFYLTIGKKLRSLDFGASSLMSDNAKKEWTNTKKELNQKKFDTDLEFSSDFSKRKIILDGFYEVTISNNKKIELTQISYNDTVKMTLPESVLKHGKVQYSDDRPN
jgi:hypothetical protein